MAKFVVFYNSELLKTYELDEPVISIGRLPENTISIANMGVSRRHVKIEEDTDRSYVLSDLNSLNGTYVNGKRIKKVTLRTGDKISIGKYTILYEATGESRESAPVPEAAPAQPAEPPPRQSARDLAGTAADFSYVHRTTEPHMRAVPEKSAGDGEKNGEREQAGAELIETNKHVVYKIDKKYLTMGSGDDDDIFVSGFMVGSNQISIEVQSDGIFINSGKLLGKMKVNGKPKRRHLLQHKDRIEIGSSTFRFMENG
jgi:pSer/pThr/pTyr-binding forkhead associated (FHA) protein